MRSITATSEQDERVAVRRSSSFFQTHGESHKGVIVAIATMGAIAPATERRAMVSLVSWSVLRGGEGIAKKKRCSGRGAAESDCVW